MQPTFKSRASLTKHLVTLILFIVAANIQVQSSLTKHLVTSILFIVAANIQVQSSLTKHLVTSILFIVAANIQVQSSLTKHLVTLILFIVAVNIQVQSSLTKHLVILILFIISAKIHGAEFFDRMPGLCQTVASLCTISCVSSLMTIALMSVNRYFYICQHEKYRIIFTYRNVIFMCLSLYLVGTFLVLLNLAGIGDHSFDHKSYECIWDRMATFPYTVVFSVTLVWIPTLITGTCYLRIYLYVSAHRRKIRQQHDANDVQKATPTLRKLNLAKTLFTIYAVFTTCWIPYALLIVIDSKDEFPHEVHIYITMFAHLHPSLNWIIYYVTNKKFADAYKQLFHTAFGGSCYHTRANTQSSDRALDARKDTSKEMTETTTRLQRQELKLEDSNSSNSHSKPRQPKEDKESHI